MLISLHSHCGILIIVELAINYGDRGVALGEIARRHYLPADMLPPVMDKLCQEGIVRTESTDHGATLLHLNRNPSELYVLEIVMLFDQELFRGKFPDQTTGGWLPLSAASRFINMERTHYINYLRGKLKKINIKRWCDMLEQGNNYSLFAPDAQL